MKNFLPVLDVDLEMYVAGGVFVHDLRRNFTVWQEQLDLTTDLTSLRAHIYSSPTVIDLDDDGDLEIVVGTSLGYIYVLSAHTGETRKGFPIHMSEIQAQVTVEDVNGDGLLELIAADVLGNVLCFDRNGQEIWERQVAGFVSQGATFGDVNGDGVMDVVVGTLAGHVWALRGDNGQPLPNFPLRTDDRILAPITLVNLDTTDDIRKMHLSILRQRLGQKAEANSGPFPSVFDAFPNMSALGAPPGEDRISFSLCVNCLICNALSVRFWVWAAFGISLIRRPCLHRGWAFRLCHQVGYQ